jgi:hypothetical protein
MDVKKFSVYAFFGSLSVVVRTSVRGDPSEGELERFRDRVHKSRYRRATRCNSNSGLQHIPS